MSVAKKKRKKSRLKKNVSRFFFFSRGKARRWFLRARMRIEVDGRREDGVPSEADVRPVTACVVTVRCVSWRALDEEERRGELLATKTASGSAEVRVAVEWHTAPSES